MTVVNISETNALSSRGSIRAAGDPVPPANDQGQSWQYTLGPGRYIFNVSFIGIAGNTTQFTFSGATATTLSSFPIPGTPGSVGGDTRDIAFTV